MKVAHVTTIDRSLRYLLINQLSSIRRAGYEIIGISSPGPEAPVLESAGIRHVAVPMSRSFTPLADLISLWRLYGVLRRESCVIVHTHNPKPGLLGQLAARMAGVPIVINTLHGFYFHDYMHPAWRRFYITMEKVAARCSDVILSQNREDIETAIREGICSSEKIKYLGNGIDITEFDPARFSDEDVRECKQELGIPSDVPVVGFVGRLSGKRKGFWDFLAAGSEIVKKLSGVRFLIVGKADTGKPDAVGPEAAADYGIADVCLFLGHQPNHKLPRLYKIMDVLVLPSLFEGVPRVVMEASAMKVPAVVTDVKGNREAVEQKCNGLLVPLGDIKALAKAIVELLENPKEARRMGEEGRRLALERFDERLIFDKVLAEYARLLVEKGYPVSASSGSE